MRGPDLSYTTDDTKKIKRISGIKKQEENILNAILTDLGSRPNLPNYGSKLYKLRFQLITDQFLDMCTLFIRDCIITSVPEVTVEKVTHEVNRRNRWVKTYVEFKDKSSGQLGQVGLTYSGGEFLSK